MVMIMIEKQVSAMTVLVYLTKHELHFTDLWHMPKKCIFYFHFVTVLYLHVGFVPVSVACHCFYSTINLCARSDSVSLESKLR